MECLARPEVRLAEEIKRKKKRGLNANISNGTKTNRELLTSTRLKN